MAWEGEQVVRVVVALQGDRRQPTTPEQAVREELDSPTKKLTRPQGGQERGAGGGRSRGEKKSGGGGCETALQEPKSIGRIETSPWDLGAHPEVHKEEGGASSSPVGRRGVNEKGITRWGIEGIRLGASDRFGRGRGEFTTQFRAILNCHKYSVLV